MGDEHDHQQRPDRPGFGTPPGHIPVPPEKPWNAEPADPYEQIERRNPFEGRQASEVVRPDEISPGLADVMAQDEPIPAGQPLPRTDGDEPGGS
jgi:hypothetical protein